MKLHLLLLACILAAAAPHGTVAFSSSAVASRVWISPLPTVVSYTPFKHSDNLPCSRSVLLMSSTNGDSTKDAKIEGRKKRVIIGYKAMLLSYLAVAVSSIIKAPVKSLSPIGGYIVMPAGISYILISAAKHDRLGSDTYKRLNLALLEYGAVGLAAISLRGNKQMMLPLLLSVINPIKGFAYGVLGYDKQSTETTLLKDLTKGTKDTIKGFRSIPKNIKSFGYMSATYMVSSLKLIKLYEIGKFIQANSITADLAMLLARFNRLAFLALMIYTLKDAADRDRLGGGTFIQLNYLCSIAMAVQCAFYTGGYTTPLGALSAFFSAFFFMNGISSYMKNHYA